MFPRYLTTYLNGIYDDRLLKCEWFCKRRTTVDNVDHWCIKCVGKTGKNTVVKCLKTHCRPYKIHHNEYCLTHTIEPKANDLNSDDPEHCLYNMNCLVWERGESKQLQRIITYSVLLRKCRIWWKAPFLALYNSFVNHQYMRSQVVMFLGIYIFVTSSDWYQQNQFSFHA